MWYVTMALSSHEHAVKQLSQKEQRMSAPRWEVLIDINSGALLFGNSEQGIVRTLPCEGLLLMKARKPAI